MVGSLNDVLCADQTFNNTLHYRRADAVAEQVYTVTPRSVREAIIFFEAHSAFELRHLEHSHFKAVVARLNQSKSIDRSDGPQGPG